MSMKRLGVVLAVCVFVSSLLPGQSRTSSISGVARDETGAVLPGVTVTVRNVDTGSERTVVTDDEGRYRVRSLELGSYSVSGSLSGFKTSIRSGVTLNLDREAVVNLVLSVGEVTEEVTIVGEAQLVDLSSSALSGLVTEETIRDLPLNGRDYLQLATLQTGIHFPRAHGSGGTNTGQGMMLVIAGSRPVQNNFRMDGTSTSDYSSGSPGSINNVNLGVDGIREFNVLSSTYSAEFGRAAGGVINVATRSGTNEFHGTLFFFHRNDNLDARDFFDPGDKPEFRRHQYGVSIGGPIIKDRTFFFFNAEYLDEARGNTSIDETISDAARAGNLTTGTVIVDPAVQPILDLYPRPNGAIFGDTGQFIFTNPTLSDEDYYLGRIDHRFSDSDTLFGRYLFDDGDEQNLSTFALSEGRDATRSQYFTLEETHVFSPAVLNTARFGFTRKNDINNIQTALNPALDNADLSFLPGQINTIGRIVVSGLDRFPGGTGGADADINIFNTFQFSDDLAWEQGAHSIKIGGMVERDQFNPNSQNRQSGEWRFPDVEEFLTNQPDRFRSQFPGSDTIRGWRQSIFAWYVQDDWQIRPNLKLNLGLRHEWVTVPTEVNGKMANLVNLTDPTNSIVDKLYENPSLENFAPRLGLAWDPFGKGTTSVRAGYGIFYDQILSNVVILAGNRTAPFFRRGETTIVFAGDFPTRGLDRLVADVSSQSTERLPPDPGQSYVQQWNLNIQQEIGFDSVVEVGYVGSRGVKLTSFIEDANLVIPTILPPDGRRFYPEDGQVVNPLYSKVRNHLREGSSFYHGLKLGLRKRWSQGFRYQFSYAFGKIIDDNSSTFSHDESANARGIPLNDDVKFSRGPANHDLRHNFSMNSTWDIPFPQDSGLRHLLGGWQLGTILSATTGPPNTPSLSYDAARTGTATPSRQGGQRPDLVPGANLKSTGDPNQWWDPAAFARPTPGFHGDAARGILIGPSFVNLDFTLIKQTPFPQLGEQGRVDFRLEFFNILNHTNFALPSASRMEIFSASRTRADFARITSAFTAREIQMGLKMFF